MYLDNNKTQLISQEDINDYNNFNFNELVNRTFKYHKLNQSTNIYSTLVEIKFIPINDNYTMTSAINNTINNVYNDKKDINEEVINSHIGLKNNQIISYNTKNKTSTNNNKPKIKIEIVVENTVKLPKNSMLEKVISCQPDFLTQNNEKQIQVVQELFNTDKKIDKLKIANADLGVKNSATLTFNTNHKAIVLSNDLYYKQINKVDEKIDKLKSSLIPIEIKQIQQEYDKEKQQYLEKTKQLFMDIINSKEYKELQLKVSSSGNNSLEKTNKQKIKNNTNFNNNNANIEQQILNSLFNEKVKALTKPKLNQQQLSLLKLHYETIYSNNELIQLQSYKENFKKDYLHKLSKFILDDLVNKNINLLIIGKNDFWKQNSNKGKQNNKNVYNFPHTELIKLIQYKAIKYGIVVLITEESYTSKTSFINDIELKKYNNNVNCYDDLNKREKIVIDVKTIIEEIKNSENSIKAEDNEKQLSLFIPSLGNKSHLNTSSMSHIEKINKTNKKQSNINTYGGYRKNRDTYVNSNNIKSSTLSTKNVKQSQLTELHTSVHADVNASFNMSKKVFPSISYNPKKHNLNYENKYLQLNAKKFKIVKIKQFIALK